MLILTEYQALEKAFFTKAVNYKLESTQKSAQKIAISIKICTNRMYNNQISLSKDYNKVKHI